MSSNRLAQELAAIAIECEAITSISNDDKRRILSLLNVIEANILPKETNEEKVAKEIERKYGRKTEEITPEDNIQWGM